MTSPGLRERKKQKTRWAIQEQALRLFAEQGYDATTVEQIAAAAEVSPSTFFRYFPTKEDVVIQDDYDPMMVRAMDTAPAELNPIEALRYAITHAFSQVGVAELGQLRERTRLILSVPALRARALDNLNATVAVMADPIARRLGCAPTDLRPRTWAGAFVGVVMVLAEQWITQDGVDFVALVDEALAELATGFPDSHG